jgi:hypothetical protein
LVEPTVEKPTAPVSEPAVVTEKPVVVEIADSVPIDPPLAVAVAAPEPSPPPAIAGNLSAPININAYPWARIEIAGRTIGETPIGELRLPRGSHDVRAIFADGSSRVRRVNADGNERFIMFGTPAQ